MAFLSRSLPRLAVLSVLANLGSAGNTPMEYCASLNTGTGSGTFDTYQSDGLCKQQCTDYAFSIIKDSLCWCSNIAPDDSVQVDTSECNKSCPGFPSDTCGGDGVYGYIAQGNSPTSTAGGSGGSTPTSTTSDDSTTTTSAPSVSTSTPTVVPTTTSQTTSSTSTSTFTTTSTSTSTPEPTTTSKPQPTNTNTEPITSVSTVTQGGTVSLQTVTVTPTYVPNESDSNTATAVPQNKGLSTGAAVGVAIGVVAGFLMIAGAVAWIWWRKRKQQEAAMVARSNSGRGSSNGMMGTPRTEMASIWDSERLSTGRRNSRIMPHDPRMDPFSGNIYGRFENKSRESINTLQDNHDYSRRVLRTTNPDPE